MIYVNGRFLAQKITGVNRFAIEICKALIDIGVDLRVVVPKWFRGDTYDLPIINFGHLKSHFWEQIDLLLFLKLKGAPLLVNLSGLGPICYRNQIITIHDLSFFYNRHWFSMYYYLLYSIVTPILSKRCRHILTVSNFSKSEIIRYLNVEANSVTVLGNAVSENLLKSNSEPRTRRVNSNMFVLGVSSIDPRKNFVNLIKAYNKIDLPNIKLFLVGRTSNNFNIDIKDILAEGTSTVQFLDYVSDCELKKLYSEASAFIYPSLYEGFGIPPLEAMANGCPVIVSDIPSLRETCGNAALYIDPNEEDDIADKIIQVIVDNNLRDRLIANGYEQVNKFSWNNYAVQLKKVVNNID